MKTKILLAGLGVVALTAGPGSAQTISVLTDDGPNGFTIMEALTEAYSEKHPDVKFDIELRPGGGGGDNIVKTRLATGEMADVFFYNTGSLFQALNPTRTLAPLTDLPNMGNVNESFYSVVSDADGEIYGVPIGPAMGGGIFYNRQIYEELGLEIPRTWDELIANAQAAKDAGYVGVVQTHGSTWTGQLLVLSDFYNVAAADPDFAERYTANEAKFADTPSALAGFEHKQQIFDLGLLNEDFGAATFEEGILSVASGEAAHYPMLTSALRQVIANMPEALPNLGFFAQPGTDPDVNGLTVWTPGALYVPAESDNKEAALDFLDFVMTVEACEATIEAAGTNGPYLIEGCELPDDVPQAVADMLPYFETEGGTRPALEFLSPIKGPNLEHILIEVGSGIRSAAEGAALYDQDVVKQARQLNLPGWE